MNTLLNIIQPYCHRFGLPALTSLLLLSGAISTETIAAQLVPTGQSDAGTLDGVPSVTHTGRFTGATAHGEFLVPYEITAPADPRHGNRRVVFEPPHFTLRTPGRDAVLGTELLFGRGYSHASVGFSNQGENMLDTGADNFTIAGLQVGENDFPFPRDVEILKQFVEALHRDPVARATLGHVRKVYAFGTSQSAEALYELAYGPGAANLFDLTVLQVPLWRPAFARPDTLAVLPEVFEPLEEIGKVMLVSAEGDLLISQSMQLRNALASPNYRLYELAGAPHLFMDIEIGGIRTNPLDHSAVVRAVFVAGDRWVRRGKRPPNSRILDVAAPGTIDPIYLFETGIARDVNGNASGGVRFPDVANGRALHIASLLDIELIPGLPGLIGAWFDLACAPEPGSATGQPRFTSHRQYVHSVWQQAFSLMWDGYLLPRDALQLLWIARDSDVGRPQSCAGTP